MTCREPFQNDIWHGVQVSLLDASTSVREAAVDLIGRFILLKPELVSRYYKMLSARILVSLLRFVDECVSGGD